MLPIRNGRPLVGLNKQLLNQRVFLRNPKTITQSRAASQQPADSPGFKSLLDNPPVLVKAGKPKKTLGLIIIAAIPVIAFGLGTWQVFRLQWKVELLARLEDHLIRDPLPLPPFIDPSAVKDFDYRRVYATGRLRHDQEMLIGPRIHDGDDGYLVVTPLERKGGATTVLVNRGWISKAMADRAKRPEGLPFGEVTVEGLLREPWKKNMFTPANKPETGEFFFPDVKEMAQLTGSQPIWIEETMEPDLITALDREAKGIPIGRAAEVNLRNNHTQYIFTWYSLSAATSVMLWMLLRGKSGGRGMRHNTQW